MGKARQPSSIISSIEKKKKKSPALLNASIPDYFYGNIARCSCCGVPSMRFFRYEKKPQMLSHKSAFICVYLRFHF